MLSSLLLRQISTSWTLLNCARSEPSDRAREARERLLNVYWCAAYKFLLCLTNHDEHRANELSQEFSLRFIQGKFDKVDRSKGKFRNYLAQSLRYLELEDRRQSRPLAHIAHSIEEASTMIELEFDEEARRVIMDQAPEDLRLMDSSDRQSLFNAFVLKEKHENASSSKLSIELSTKLSRSINAKRFDQIVSEGRKLFADRIIVRVRATCSDGSLEEVEQALIDLGLHGYPRVMEAMRRFPWI